MPILSVIIPTYNSEKTIESCLTSLIFQTYQNFEICILDGCSSDETISKAKNICSSFKNLKIISEPDQGVYDAMNKGIDIAQGDWLYFIGSDDELVDINVFTDIFKNSTLKKYGIVYGNARVLGDTSWGKTGQVYDGIFNIRKLLVKNICHQAIFYRKELFQRFGKYNLKYPVCADWEMNIRLFTKTDSLYLDRIIANFYSGGLSSKPFNDPIKGDLKRIKQNAIIEYNMRKITSFLRLG